MTSSNGSMIGSWFGIKEIALIEGKFKDSGAK